METIHRAEVYGVLGLLGVGTAVAGYFTLEDWKTVSKDLEKAGAFLPKLLTSGYHLIQTDYEIVKGIWSSPVYAGRAAVTAAKDLLEGHPDDAWDDIKKGGVDIGHNAKDIWDKGKDLAGSIKDWF